MHLKKKHNRDIRAVVFTDIACGGEECVMTAGDQNHGLVISLMLTKQPYMKE